jgi:hypothetical protein
MFRRGNWEIVPDLRQLASRDAGNMGMDGLLRTEIVAMGQSRGFEG